MRGTDFEIVTADELVAYSPLGGIVQRIQTVGWESAYISLWDDVESIDEWHCESSDMQPWEAGDQRFYYCVGPHEDDGKDYDTSDGSPTGPWLGRHLRWRRAGPELIVPKWLEPWDKDIVNECLFCSALLDGMAGVRMVLKWYPPEYLSELVSTAVENLLMEAPGRDLAAAELKIAKWLAEQPKMWQPGQVFLSEVEAEYDPDA